MIKQLLGFDDKTPITMSVFRLLLGAVVIGWGAYAYATTYFVPRLEFATHCKEQSTLEVKMNDKLDRTLENTIAIISALKQHNGYKF